MSVRRCLIAVLICVSLTVVDAAHVFVCLLALLQSLGCWVGLEPLVTQFPVENTGVFH